MFLNKRLVENNSHKTVIVLDRGPKFAKLSGEEVLLTFKDDNPANITSILPKTLWNCSVEAALEFHRIVADLFPRGSKQLSFIMSDMAARFLTRAWPDKLIPYEDLLNAFSTCDLPQAVADESSCSIMNGISMAIEALSERTKLQEKASEISREHLAKAAEFKSIKESLSNNSKKRLEMLRKIFGSHKSPSTNRSSTDGNEEDEDEEGLIKDYTDGSYQKEVVDDKEIVEDGNAAATHGKPLLRNFGTIVVLTALEREDEYDEINKAVLQLIRTRNEAIRLVSDENMLTIDGVNLIVVNLLDGEKRRDLDTYKLSSEYETPILHSMLTSAIGGEALLATIRKILQNIYDLVSTTVSGIPMKSNVKEEAQQGQSTNYDVELLHRRAAHVGLASMGLLSKESKIVTKLTEDSYITIRLGWCTSGPKLKSDKFPLLQSSHLITPASVNSRPTVCLTSFVLSGKCVLLEVRRDALSGAPMNDSATSNGKSSDGKVAEDSSLSSDTAKAMIGSGSTDPKSLLPANLHQKFISHYLCRDEATGALVIQSVVVGSNATLNGFLVPEVDLVCDNKNKVNKEEYNLSFMRHFMTTSTLVMRPAIADTSRPIPGTGGVAISTPKLPAIGGCVPEMSWVQRLETTRRLRQNVWNLTQYCPYLLYDSFIFHFPQVFENFLSILSKPVIEKGDFDAACGFIFTLPVFRNGIEGVNSFVCVHNAKKVLTKEEQFRLIFDELSRLINNTAQVSVMHMNLLKTLMQICGMPYATPPVPIAIDLVAEHERRAAEAANALSRMGRKRLPDTAHEREMINMAKRLRKRFSSKWQPDESINLLEHFATQQQQNRWTKWKDFVGREKSNGEAQAKLYPNLVLPEPAPTIDAPNLPPELAEKAAAILAASAAQGTGEKGNKQPLQQQQVGNKPPPHKQGQLPRNQQHGGKPMGRGHHQPMGGNFGTGRGGAGGMRGKPQHSNGAGGGQPHHGGRGRGTHFGGRPMSRRGGGGGAVGGGVPPT